jgi:hypothetical protein
MSTVPTLDELRLVLQEHASVADRDTVSAPSERAITVRRRARAARRRRAGAVSALALATTAAVAAVVLQGGLSDPTPDRAAPAAPTAGPDVVGSGPRYTGYRYPMTLEVSGHTYELGAAYEPAPGSRRIHIETEASRTPRAMAWSTSSDTRGYVTVTVDGVVVSRSTAGALESGAVLSPGRPHVVKVRADKLRGHQRLALVVYEEAAR